MTTVALLTIRPIEGTDGAALERFHAGLSAETQRRRFLMYHPALDRSEVAWFTHVDHTDREALVALADGSIIGVARYDRVAPREAEVAVVVADEWQRLGTGTALLARLAERARTAGVTTFVADTLPENVAVERLLARVGAVADRVVEDGVARLRIDLRQPPSQRKGWSS